MLVLLYVDLVQNPKIKIIGRVQTITLTPPKTTETNNEIHIKKIYYWDFTGMWSMYCTGFCNEISSPSENMYDRIKQNKRSIYVYQFFESILLQLKITIINLWHSYGYLFPRFFNPFTKIIPVVRNHFLLKPKMKQILVYQNQIV